MLAYLGYFYKKAKLFLCLFVAECVGWGGGLESVLEARCECLVFVLRWAPLCRGLFAGDNYRKTH